MRVEEERMKESWMDKLIELRWDKLIEPLEKYLLELAKRNPLYTNFNVNLSWVSILWVHETILISKEFWFIQRLVEHDKIDQFYYESTVRVKRYIDEYEEYDYVFPMDYEQLIMLLSIKDKPIEWLCEILK